MTGADPRIAPVEDNILFFVDRVLTEGPDWLIDRSGPHVSAYSSDKAFPLFNVVVGARVDEGDGGELASKVGSEFIARGLPWMWWTTPSHTTPELEEVLAELGLVREEVPGMHANLGTEPELAQDIEVAEVPADNPDFGHVLIKGFELPEFVLRPMQDFLGSLGPGEQIVVVGSLRGQAAGVATGLVSGETIGIYNVTTLAEHRGRGVGTAVTAAIMHEGKRRGCTQAILHTSAMGRRVYERLGFEVVCPTAHWVWTPRTK